MKFNDSLGVLVAFAGLSIGACSSSSNDSDDSNPAANLSTGGRAETGGDAGSGGTQPASGGSDSAGSSGTLALGGGGSAGSASGGSESGGVATGGRSQARGGMASAAGRPSDGKPFDIAFEYAYDTAGFYDEPKRKIMAAAAAAWSRYIAEDFPNIPAGTVVRTRHPEHVDREGMNFVLDYEIDDLVLVLGSQALDGTGAKLASTSSSFAGGVADRALLELLQKRYDEHPFEPWIAQTTFDPDEPWAFDETPDTDDDLADDRQDFMSTAIHEIGHALGIGSAQAWDDLVVDATFVGPKAMAVYGGPVPLEADAAHFAHDTMIDGKTPSLELGTLFGERKRPTKLDLAVLEDLGYTIRWELVD